MSNPGPFNGFKGDVYEGGIRVPYVIHWPARVPAGKRYDSPVINLDVVPTIAAACGFGEPKGNPFDGKDLLPYLNGKHELPPHHVLHWRRGEDYAIRRGDWKLCYNDANGPATIQLFNLKKDRGENHDLSASHPERAQAMKNAFDAWEAKLPEGQWGKTPSNRNSRYASGARVDVAAFNANRPVEEKSKRKRRR
jgi:arylsulfatase A-like enzyme